MIDIRDPNQGAENEDWNNGAEEVVAGYQHHDPEKLDEGKATVEDAVDLESDADELD